MYGGNYYTGGIVGQGMDPSGNYAMVNTGRGAGQRVAGGSIAGDVDEDGSVSGNVYLENGIGAVDGVTYMDQAAAVTYEELLAAEGLPEEFKVMHVTFLADGQPVKVLKCSYGEAVSQTQDPGGSGEGRRPEGSRETADPKPRDLQSAGAGGLQILAHHDCLGGGEKNRFFWQREDFTRRIR